MKSIKRGHQTWKFISQQQPTAEHSLGTKHRQQRQRNRGDAALGSKASKTAKNGSATPLPQPHTNIREYRIKGFKPSGSSEQASINDSTNILQHKYAQAE
ncbi:hypothetical protein Nepgr_010540 [Nepenthes gracilis]|uniref:Uncharacterized protein n=1 Tax=Nepenthes gracilis TaxID=150966 RepID=A0AAD3XLF1_NEPGR|nr:hypothetical protein Nepgr_010540 [Nepenthes gracilis]